MNNETHPIENDYTDVLRIIKFMLLERDIFFLEAEEVLHETFIQTYKHPYTRQFFLSECKIVIKEAVRERKYRDKDATATDDKEKVCLKCKELLPIGNFGVTEVYRYGGSYINSHCKSCAAKNTSEHYSKMKDNPQAYEKYLQRQREYKRKKRLEKKLNGAIATGAEGF